MKDKELASLSNLPTFAGTMDSNQFLNWLQLLSSGQGANLTMGLELIQTLDAKGVYTYVSAKYDVSVNGTELRYCLVRCGKCDSIEFKRNYHEPSPCEQCRQWKEYLEKEFPSHVTEESIAADCDALMSHIEEYSAQTEERETSEAITQYLHEQKGEPIVMQVTEIVAGFVPYNTEFNCISCGTQVNAGTSCVYDVPVTDEQGNRITSNYDRYVFAVARYCTMQCAVKEMVVG